MNTCLCFFCVSIMLQLSMVAWFCHHLSDIHVDLSDPDADLPDNHVDLSDPYVDLSLIHVLEKVNTKTFPRPICAIQLTYIF